MVPLGLRARAVKASLPPPRLLVPVALLLSALLELRGAAAAAAAGPTAGAALVGQPGAGGGAAPRSQREDEVRLLGDYDDVRWLEGVMRAGAEAGAEERGAGTGAGGARVPQPRGPSARVGPGAQARSGSRGAGTAGGKSGGAGGSKGSSGGSGGGSAPKRVGPYLPWSTGPGCAAGARSGAEEARGGGAGGECGQGPEEGRSVGGGGSSSSSSAPGGGSGEPGRPKEPQPLDFPVWWFAPFWSGSGYSSEAINYVLSLTRHSQARRGGALRSRDLWLRHHGDQARDTVVDAMAPDDREELRALEAHAGTLDASPPPHQPSHAPAPPSHDELALLAAARELGLPPPAPLPPLHPPLPRPAIVVCHSLPTNWQLPEPTGGSADQCPPDATASAYVYLVGRTMFETDRLPSVFVPRINAMNEVWVPSQWAVEVFVASGVDPAKLVVVPEGINTTWYDPALYEPMPLPQGELVFGEVPSSAAGSAERPYRLLSTFKWEPRKGWDVLLEAYLTEFTAQDNVELYIITKPFVGGGDFKKHMHNWLRRAQRRLGLPPDVLTAPGRLPRLYVISHHISDGDFPRYYKAADAFVLPSRGEGWGRPHVEALAMGLPLISTNWSGITAYLDEQVGYPISVERMTTVNDNSVWWFRGLKWAQPSVRHTRQLMRHVYTHRDEARARGAAARRRMVERYSPEVIATILAGHFRRINSLIPPLPPPM